MHSPFAVGHVIRNAIAGTLAVAGLAALALSLHAAPAAANSEGCTYTNFPNKYVCFYIYGRGTHVDKFVVIRGRLDKGDNGICNFEGRVRVTAPDHTTWDFTSDYRAGCQQGRATRTIRVDRDFPDGSRACGSFYENGQLQDSACNKIER
jgi:hypothetical protein